MHINQNKLLIITEYPNQGEIHGRGAVGGATYTKIILSSLKKFYPKVDITVASQTTESSTQSVDDGITVNRIWKRGSLSSLGKLFSFALFHPASHIVSSFEGYMFGKEYHAAVFLLMIILLRVLGKQTTMILHQVPSDFSNIEQHKLKALVMQLAKNFVYTLILLGNNHVIVFEEAFRNQLTKNPKGKVTFIPLPVPKTKSVSKRFARKKLGLNANEFYALYFGFFAPYKGVDWLVENWNHTDFGAQLLLAGGLSPHYINDKRVVSFVRGVEQKAKHKGIKTPGFIAEKDLSLYFSAADVLVMPYKTFMSSSGPMALAFSYNLPVLFSHKLEGYTKSDDMKMALKQSKLTSKDIIFTHSQISLKQTLLSAKKNYTKFALFAKLMKDKRSEEQVSKAFYETIITRNEAITTTSSVNIAINPAFIKSENASLSQQ